MAPAVGPALRTALSPAEGEFLVQQVDHPLDPAAGRPGSDGPGVWRHRACQ
jgi:hypothetical protein